MRGLGLSVLSLNITKCNIGGSIGMEEYAIFFASKAKRKQVTCESLDFFCRTLNSHFFLNQSEKSLSF